MSDVIYGGTINAGALVRRQIRAWLEATGISYTEHKGLLESTFAIRGTRAQWQQIHELVQVNR